MTDILFIFCRLNPDIGYRQGMHEVLAPILWVMSRDAIDTKAAISREEGGTPTEADQLPQMCLDMNYIEHDSFTLFCILMQTAKSFYELGGNSSQTSLATSNSSAIVERSRRIHEVYLRRTDPELTEHLISIDILPQIFVM